MSASAITQSEQAASLVTTGDQWKQVADTSFAYSFRTGPCIPPIEHMLSAIAASHLPLNKATGVLDTGCGPGVVMANLIWQHGHDIPTSARLLATDFSSAMIESMNKLRAHEQAKQDQLSNVWHRLETQILDAQELSTIPNASLSHVLSNYVYFMLPDPRKALIATQRVLQDGGIFAQASWQGNEWMDIIEAGVKSIGRQMLTLPEAWTSVERVRGELEWAGFRDIDVQYVETYMDFSDHEVFCSEMMKIPATQNIIKGASACDLDLMKKCMVDKLKAWHPQPGRLKGVAVVSLAIK